MENGTSRRAFARCKGEEVAFACDHGDRYSVEATAVLVDKREQDARANPDPAIIAAPDENQEQEASADPIQSDAEPNKGGRNDWSNW